MFTIHDSHRINKGKTTNQIPKQNKIKNYIKLYLAQLQLLKILQIFPHHWLIVHSYFHLHFVNMTIHFSYPTSQNLIRGHDPGFTGLTFSYVSVSMISRHSCWIQQ